MALPINDPSSHQELIKKAREMVDDFKAADLPSALAVLGAGHFVGQHGEEDAR